MVQFSFSDESGVWMNISTYSHADKNMPSLTLLPMIHLGEKDYYRAANNETLCHDSVYLEGSYVPAKRALHFLHRVIGIFSNLTLQTGKQSFFKRWNKEAADSGRGGLEESTYTHSCDCGTCYRFKLRRIRADLHRWHALKAIKAMPWWTMISFPALVIAALIAAPFMNLRDMALDIKTDDDCDCGKCDQDHFLDRFFFPIFNFIQDDRDLFLRMTLAEALIMPENQGKSLCVKYGAGHMPQLAETLLNDFGYTLSTQHAILAIKKTKALDVSNVETGYDAVNARMWERADTWQDREPKPGFIATSILTANYPTHFAGTKQPAGMNTPVSYTPINTPDVKTKKVKFA